jgi:hypothetical protein
VIVDLHSSGDSPAVGFMRDSIEWGHNLHFRVRVFVNPADIG